MDFPIAEILANFAVAGIVFYFSNQHIQYLRQELDRERREHEQLQKQYMEDLRDWSGINPRWQTWNERPRVTAESDTKIRAQFNLSDEERLEAVRRMNE